MSDSVKNWTTEELRAEVRELRDAIFAYEMSGDTHRIDAANARLKQIFDELNIRNPEARK